MSNIETGSHPAKPKAPMGIEELTGSQKAEGAAKKDTAALPRIVSESLKIGDLEAYVEKLSTPSSVVKMHAAAMAQLGTPTGAYIQPALGTSVPADAEGRCPVEDPTALHERAVGQRGKFQPLPSDQFGSEGSSA